MKIIIVVSPSVGRGSSSHALLHHNVSTVAQKGQTVLEKIIKQDIFLPYLPAITFSFTDKMTYYK